MKKSRKFVALMLSLALGASVLSGCGGSSSSSTDSGTSDETTAEGDIKKGGTLNFGLSTEPFTLDPMVNAGYASRNVAYAIYEGLFKFDDDGNVINGLCKDYTQSDDKLTYTFTLTDANFQNGDPVTAEDVKFTFERIMEPDSGAYYNNLLNTYIASIDTPDEKTVTVTLKAPLYAFVNYLAAKELLIVSKSWTEEHNGDISRDPMGAGPFKFVSWDSGVSVTCEANTDYYIPDQPYLDSIVFSFYADENARVSALQTNAVDIIEYTPQAQFDAINAMDNLTVLEQPGTISYLIMSTQNEYLANKEVRQAISYCLNREDVVNAAFSGKGTVVDGSPLTEGMSGYTEEGATCYKQDLDKAKQLMADAGYADGFSIKLLTSSTYKFMEQTAVAVQSSLKEIGIDAEIESVEWSTFAQRVAAGDCELAVQALIGDVNDPDWLNVLYGKGGGWNASKYYSDQYEALMQQGAAESDETKRQEIYEQVDDLIMDDAPYAFICWRTQGDAINTKVKGFSFLGNNAWPYSGVTFAHTWLNQ